MKQMTKYKYTVFSIYYNVAPDYILLRIRARPACDQPLYSNGDRVAHRTDNSVVALLGLSPEPSHGQGFNPTPSRPWTICAG